MRFRPILILAGALLATNGAFADQANEAALEVRVKTLEQRVADLEAKLNHMAARPPSVMVVPHAETAPSAPVPPPRWKNSSNWAGIKTGLGWSEVRQLLGTPGRTTTGVFGDVWYYPDESGGRVVFDRDSRVSEFNPPHGESD